MACASTAGFHHGSSRNTYSAAVRLSPSPPALRLMRNSGHAGIRLEPLDARGAIAGASVEVLVGHAERVETRAEQREEARELREDERLVPFVDHLAEPRDQHVELRRRLVRAGRIDQPAVAGGLPQAQQRLEDLHLRPVDAVARHAREQRLAVVRAQLVVVPALRPFELALQRLLGAARQLRRDLLLGAAQDERPQRARQPREVLVGARPRRAGALERLGGSEQARVQELEQAPQLAEVVLDRRAAQREPVPRAQQPRRLGRRGRRRS